MVFSKKLEKRNLSGTNFLRKSALVGKTMEAQIVDVKEHPTFGSTVLVLAGTFEGEGPEHELTINSADENLLVELFGEDGAGWDKDKFYKLTAEDTGKTYNGRSVLKLVIAE